MTGARPLLFYGGFPLGYHNPEAERKARAMADWGFEVHYVSGVGIRNPGLGHAGDVAARLVAAVGRERRAPAGAGEEALRPGSVLVVPPRQLAPIRDLNERWLLRQLRALLPDWRRAVVWARWPTPELVAILPRLRPAAVVYECVDAYDQTPGITGGWLGRFESAERALAGLADVVVVPSEPLAQRFRSLARRVEVLPHGVDLELFPYVAPRAGPRDGATIGFVGTLDYRIDAPLVDAAAQAHPDWRLRLVGPVQEGFEVERFTRWPNVSVEPPVPYAEVGALVASFDAGMMPYVDHPVYHAMTPLKNIEMLAVGRPAAARPTGALEAFSDLIYLGDDPPSFTRALERALAEDSPALAARRRAVAEGYGWDAILDRVRGLLASLPA